MSQRLQHFNIKIILGIPTSLEFIARLISGSVLFLVLQMFPQDFLFRSLNEILQTNKKKTKLHNET